MSHMNDERGCSKAQTGEERYEFFEVRIGIERRPGCNTTIAPRTVNCLAASQNPWMMPGRGAMSG